MSAWTISRRLLRTARRRIASGHAGTTGRISIRRGILFRRPASRQGTGHRGDRGCIRRSRSQDRPWAMSSPHSPRSVRSEQDGQPWSAAGSVSATPPSEGIAGRYARANLESALQRRCRRSFPRKKGLQPSRGRLALPPHSEDSPRAPPPHSAAHPAPRDRHAMPAPLQFAPERRHRIQVPADFRADHAEVGHAPERNRSPRENPAR